LTNACDFYYGYYQHAFGMIIFMSTENLPHPQSNDENVYYSPGAFSLMQEVSIGLHHDREALGQIATDAAYYFGEDYGLSAGPEDRLLVYRYARAGASSHREPPLGDAPSGMIYSATLPAVTPDGALYSKITADQIRTLGPALDMPVATFNRKQPPVRHYVHALIYPKPEDSGFLVSGKAWTEFFGEMTSRVRGGPDLSNRAKVRFMQHVLTTYGDAITFDPR